MSGLGIRLVRYGLPGALGEPDQLLRLARFRDTHPEVIIGDGGFGMAAARMRSRLQASHAAEAAARRSAADMAGQLEQTCLQLRRPAAIVHGFTGYCRQQGTFPPSRRGRMLQRVTREITRMETLVKRMRMRSAGEPTGPDRGPGPIATDPAAHARLPGTRKPPANGDHAT